VTAARGQVGAGDWVAERSFAHPLGFGGKVDLHGPARVIDFKTKEFGPDSKVNGWSEQCMQLAACRHGLEMPLAPCANVFISVTHPGLATTYEWSEEDLVQGWEKFKCLLRFWQIDRRYKP